MFNPDDNVRDLFHLDPDDRRWRASAPWSGRYDDRWPDERLRHLVLVDGRLVDAWVEPVEGSEWAHHARSEDERRGLDHRPSLPAPHPYDEVLGWLDALVGGRRALDAMTDAPLEPATMTPDPVGRVLEQVVDAVFDREVLAALHDGLERLRAHDPEAVLRRKTVPQVAGGLCWVVGRANGLFGPETPLIQKDVQHRLGLSSSISGLGTSIARALRDLAPDAGRRPVHCPDLLAVGDLALLTSPTRVLLVRWRDRALAARDAHRADLLAAGPAIRSDDAVLPSEVES